MTAKRVEPKRRTRAGYGRNERRRRADLVRVHVEQYGWVCPGWQRDAHPSTDLTADHVNPRAAGGRIDGPLRVLCRSCNSARQAELDTPAVPGLAMTLVAGPPAAGKNFFVRAHAGPQDLVLDYDAIATALQVNGAMHGHVEAHKPFVCEARDAVLDRLVLGNHDVRRVWVINAAAKRAVRESYRRRYGARVVVVLAAEEVCLRRAMGERPDQWRRYVRAWFDAYEPDDRDEIIKGA
ncbi:HNH endonuclease [Actinomadura sp. DC4]|uniref:HNH endonuclease n=1 Tax=Actinomadura sp. DC4 TaxID=3055069 RepID=UPI0025B21D8B|nr:HNH endonuclease [Actinomadura sp. DC4]MDN3356068.1 HNH endonuclease [Actinomadura sp. DC4]